MIRPKLISFFVLDADEQNHVGSGWSVPRVDQLISLCQVSRWRHCTGTAAAGRDHWPAVDRTEPNHTSGWTPDWVWNSYNHWCWLKLTSELIQISRGNNGKLFFQLKCFSIFKIYWGEFKIISWLELLVLIYSVFYRICLLKFMTLFIDLMNCVY